MICLQICFYTFYRCSFSLVLVFEVTYLLETLIDLALERMEYLDLRSNYTPYLNARCR